MEREYFIRLKHLLTLKNKSLLAIFQVLLSQDIRSGFTMHVSTGYESMFCYLRKHKTQVLYILYDKK